MTRLLINFLMLLLLSQPFPDSALAADCQKLPAPVARERLTLLSAAIRHHDRLYYEKNSPEISDAEYDRLFSELTFLERCFPSLAEADSPTRSVGGVAGDASAALRHDTPMLSLASSTGPEAVAAMLRKLASAEGLATLLVQPKVDGLPVELVYLEGELVSAATRGDGHYGETVTARVRLIKGIPVRLKGSYPLRVVVRGEIYADVTAAKGLGVGNAGAYATLRHLAAGTLLSGEPVPQALAALRFFPFELVGAMECCDLTSDSAALRLLSGWGFPVMPEQTQLVAALDEVRAVYLAYLAGREQLPFAVDGIVVKVDDLALRGRMGEGRRAPFWAAAWKFPPAMASTRVREIRWQVGRTGRRTPVAVVAPVKLGGITVRRVSLHNSAEIARLGIKAGDRVVVALVGDVIPQIVEVTQAGSAGGVLVPVAAGTTASGADACFRDSPGCRERFLARAAYFTSKAGLDIAGLGRGRLKLLLEAGLVDDLPSIFRLSAAEAEIVAALGPKTALKVTASLKSRRQPPHFRVIAALGIAGVGPVASQRLTLEFPTLAALLAADEQQVDDLAQSAGAARLVREFFGTADGLALLADFRNIGFW